MLTFLVKGFRSSDLLNMFLDLVDTMPGLSGYVKTFDVFNKRRKDDYRHAVPFKDDLSMIKTQNDG